MVSSLQPNPTTVCLAQCVLLVDVCLPTFLRDSTCRIGLHSVYELQPALCSEVLSTLGQQMLPVCPSPNNLIALSSEHVPMWKQSGVWKRESGSHLFFSSPSVLPYWSEFLSREHSMLGLFWETTGVTQLSLGHREGIRTHTPSQWALWCSLVMHHGWLKTSLSEPCDFYRTHMGLSPIRKYNVLWIVKNLTRTLHYELKLYMRFLLKNVDFLL